MYAVPGFEGMALGCVFDDIRQGHGCVFDDIRQGQRRCVYQVAPHLRFRAAKVVRAGFHGSVGRLCCGTCQHQVVPTLGRHRLSWAS